ncbi:1-phosphatidylinositol 4,5-bisphosphate phosphodiesterase eta-2 isoform X1 [Alexandromys fortis]|uniref:1-phosphatidylinositol 4,5-bisphosphate phosphodiesterase eta-2 isoform X1 n=2 Tax=Alexandromys fortis TaxID=100897 RepID=UPI0021527B42|nr:1-phosphatidylinositol 4,5-bisphosphate phosphodiesterase eta-2 isoform X1 [Microtus fortis]
MAPPLDSAVGPASLPEDPGPDLDSRRLFLDANVLPVVERCMTAMQEGTQMVKLRGSSKGLVRFYYLDEHRSCLRWRPSRKNEKAKISIDSIQEVSEGRQSEIFQRYPDSSFDPNCCFSIYHGSHRESLDLVSPSGEEARTWVTGLRYLMAGISDEDSLARRQRTRDQYPWAPGVGRDSRSRLHCPAGWEGKTRRGAWAGDSCRLSWRAEQVRPGPWTVLAPNSAPKWLKQTFDEADKNGDGSLSIGEVLQLLHKLNVNLPRQRVKQMFREADTDDHQGTLGFEEFCAFYKMMSTRRDLYLLMLAYSNHKDHLDASDLQRFLEVEQKMNGVTLESCQNIIEQFEPCPENKSKGVLGIDGFTNYTRSPAGDIFNPEHHGVHQDMTQPLSHYFITSSHNTYLVGDQLMSQSRVDMYAWVLQAGCRCVEVDCWDGPDGEPIVHHGYTLTSKILFKDVIETINKYAFIKNEYPVILSIENHCSVVQQKKMAQYLTDILGDKLDLSSVSSEDATMLPSPQMLKGKILVKGKKLPANISEDAEEGEVSDEDSADEIEDDCKLLNGDASTNRKRVENIAKKKLDSLIKESKIRDCEDPNDFTVSTLSPSGKLGHKAEAKKGQSKVEEDAESGEDTGTSRRNSRLLMSSFSRRKKKGSKIKKVASVEEGDEILDSPGSQSRGTARQKKTMKLSRALSDLVKYTKSVGTHDVETEVASSWQVSSFSETKAHQILQQKPAQYLRFNQHQLSRIYPSSYRVDSSNYNPQPFWNAGCQMVALNYQSEGRMLQLNRAKFSANGGCGYVLKPQCMCQGVFNPNSEDPLPGQLKKQLALRIISGQQLPKPRDSVLGDRGEIIDPFVEVEVIGLPVDCSKEQTRVVDDNGFNPMWEETLVFTVHMPEIALVRFLVWDHDPIGRDFIGQRTLAFSSMMPGYRHVYLEGMEEASIFVHVAVSDISGKVKQTLGLKGLFLRGPKPGSLDSHAAGHPPPRPSVSQRLLRRTASAPTKSQKPSRKGFPELALGTQDAGSEGAADDVAPPSPNPALEAPTQEKSGSSSPRDTRLFPLQRPISPLCSLEPIAEEPALGPGSPLQAAVPTGPSQEGPQCPVEPGAKVTSPQRTTLGAFGTLQLRTGGNRDNEEPLPKSHNGGIPSGPREGTSGRQTDSKSRSWALGHPPVVRRAKSEGQVPLEPSPVPAVYSDATGTDRLWQRLEPGSHRDSVSSSSSMSSNDTVIDLSLPSLGLCRSRESMPGGSFGRLTPRPCLASAARPDLPPVTKSKSNPNLRVAGGLPPVPDELQPRPLASRLTSLHPRPPWHHLPLVGLQDCPASAKSKSLGDLTADDFAPSFQGSASSLNCSLGVVHQELEPGLRRDTLTEQLRWLTGFQQAGDITSPTSLGPAGDGPGGGPSFLRRSSSRSQSRVRAIASRARQAQERQQRLRGLDSRGPPEEERGTPEGACSVGHEGYVDVPMPTKGAPEQVCGAAEGRLLLRL